MEGIVPQLIGALHANDKCPRLVINALFDGVVLPLWVKEKWGESLPIDLDPSYPLDLRMDDEGLHCTLSFGSASDCFFPWPSIYLVQDRETSLGLVLEEHLPDSLTVGEDGTIGPPSADPFPVVIDTTPEAVDESVETEAKARRAQFKVIDGGS